MCTRTFSNMLRKFLMIAYDIRRWSKDDSAVSCEFSRVMYFPVKHKCLYNNRKYCTCFVSMLHLEMMC